MKTLKTFIAGAVALGALAVAIPAQAHDSHWSHHYHGHVIVYGGPYYRPYYSDYGYYGPTYSCYRPYYGCYRPYGYYYGPGISIGFGGHAYYNHWH